MKDGEKLQIHNWIVENIEMDGVDYVEVRTAAGDFRVMYKIGTMIYSLLNSVGPNDKELLESLSVMFGNIYASASIVNGSFQHEVLMATVKLLESGAVEEVSEEENQRIIEEERQAYMERKKNEESGDDESNITQQ